MSRYDFTGVLEWEQIPGWFNLAKALAVQQIVKRLPSGSTLVELGSFQGRSSIAIAAVMPSNCTLFCVDHFEGSEEHKQMNLDLDRLADSFRKNIESFGVNDRICVLQMSSTDAAQRFDPGSVDFVLLDAAHDFDSVKTDLVNWYPKLRAGGVLVCDDYEPAWPGVVQAIAVVGLKGELIARSLWCHRKPS